MVYIGLVKGNLKVLEELSIKGSSSTLWKCVCTNCGKELKCRTTKILKNNKFCYCSRVVDISKKKFGRLKPIRYVGNRKWLCRCDCGKYKEIDKSSLTCGKTKSCGCLSSEIASIRGKKHGMKKAIAAAKLVNTKFSGEVAIYRDLYNQYKSKAKGRKIKFNLNFDTFRQLLSGNCFYCDKKPNQKHNYHGRIILYNGIDRVDSSKGYEEGNVVSCCKVCNMAKSNMPLEEFIAHIEKIYKNLFDVVIP